MSTIVEAVHEYDHPIDSVIRAFTDPEFYLQKFEGVGAREVEVLAAADDDGVFTIETRRDVPLQVPSALKTFIGSWTTVLQNEEWVEGEDGEFLNQIEINSEGVPALITGSMTLAPKEDGCVNRVVMEIDCRIPLVGRKLEQFVAASTTEQLEAEYDFIREYLDGR